MRTSKSASKSASTADLVASAESSGTDQEQSLLSAASAVEADLADVIARLFAPAASRPSSADAIAQHAALMQRARAVEDAATMHREALGANPALASEFRTRETLDDVAALAAAWTPAGEPVAVREARARRRYARLIAEALVERGDPAPAARAVLDALDAEQRRLDAAAARAEEERLAAARAEEERLAAARAELERAIVAEQTAAAAAAAAAAHLQARTAVLVERLKLCGVEMLHVGRHERFDVAELIRCAPGLGAHDVNRFTAALERVEAGVSS